jgi:DNA-binding IclR family transcriptional regulator
MDSATSVEKALDILLHLHGTGALGVTGIARGVELPKSTTHRLLASLARRRLVEQDENGRYRTGLRLVALGLGVLDREPVSSATAAPSSAKRRPVASPMPPPPPVTSATRPAIRPGIRRA